MGLWTKGMSASSRLAVLLGKYHFLLYYLVTAMSPRMMITLDPSALEGTEGVECTSIPTCFCMQRSNLIGTSCIRCFETERGRLSSLPPPWLCCIYSCPPGRSDRERLKITAYLVPDSKPRISLSSPVSSLPLFRLVPNWAPGARRVAGARAGQRAGRAGGGHGGGAGAPQDHHRLPDPQLAGPPAAHGPRGAGHRQMYA